MDGCVADCEGRECGSDGCGGSCGSCGSGEVCNSGQCIPTCTPDCSGRECGPDPNCSISCGTCPAGESCNLWGICESEVLDVAPVLSGSSQSTGEINLSWTYNFVSPMSGPYFELEVSTTSATSGFGDEATLSSSTFDYTVYEAPGTYYYRIRAYDPTEFTEYSNVVTVVVADAGSAVLRIVNDLPSVITPDGYEANGLLWIWIADSQNGLYSCGDSCDLLGQDEPGTVLEPGYYQEFDVSAYADDVYWIQVQCGYWEYCCWDPPCFWTEHPTEVWDRNANNQCIVVQKGVDVYINPHTGELELPVSAILPDYSFDDSCAK